jgi:hypothetical protein
MFNLLSSLPIANGYYYGGGIGLGTILVVVLIVWLIRR